MSQTPNTAQPKVVQKLLLRTSLLLLAIAALLIGYRAFRSFGQDPGSVGSATTTDYIAAIERVKGGGQRVVVFKPDGTKLDSPGYAERANDRDFTWRPDGNQIFFSSNREENNFHIFRWNLARNEVERRTFGSRSRSAPTFATSLDRLLILTGGFVLEFDPKSMVTTQQLPPISREIGKGEEGGVQGQFDAVYRQLGNAFRAARWTPDEKYIVAVMTRDTGEILVTQNMAPAEGENPRPIGIIAGERIWFDIAPNGTVVYAVLNFRWPNEEEIPEEFIKNGRVTTPFRHQLGLITPSNTQDPERNGPLFASQEDSVAFFDPAVSPDGGSVLFTVGKYEGDGNFLPDQLNIAPFRPNLGGGPVTRPARVVAGEIYEASWHPDSRKITYIRRGANGLRSLYTILRDGTRETPISKDLGNFAMPRFSPQAPATP